MTNGIKRSVYLLRTRRVITRLKDRFLVCFAEQKLLEKDGVTKNKLMNWFSQRNVNQREHLGEVLVGLVDRQSIVVIGGGLAGLMAAVRPADGVSVE